MTTLAFPRYGQSVTADLAAEALHGSHGDLADSVYGMAVLFALDRAGSRDVGALRRDYDVVHPRSLRRLQRRLQRRPPAPGRRRRDGRWIGDLEYGRLGLPEPDHQVLLAVPTELAAQRARSRESIEVDRARDVYERDGGLQQRTGEVYAGLAAANWHGRWSVVGPEVTPAALAADISV